MAEGRLDDAARAMGGKMIAGEAGAIWRGAALDSRQVTGGELFFALPGERTDGHRYVDDAVARGAVAAVVREAMAAPPAREGRVPGLIRVPDTLAALHDLTRDVRRRVPERLIAVTGSAGKTTTKELLAGILEQRFRVARSPGNLNNLYGFPIALLAVPEGCEWMVAEMGMSEPGELARISRLGRPDVAVYTNVRAVHLEFFGSLRAIAEAKAELLDGLSGEGLLVANADDPEVARIARRFAGRVVWYGRSRAAQVRAEEVRAAAAPATGSRFVLATPDGRSEVTLPLHGGFNVDNFLAAAACAWALGVPLAEIAAAAREARPAAMRGVVRPLPGGGLLVDDSYNSNPSALEGALRSAADLAGRRHWAVLGEMRELGPEGPAFHRAAGEQAAGLGFSPVVGVGELARHLVEAAAAAGARTEWAPSAAEAAPVATKLLAPGDVVLVKGSRGVGLETVVAELIATAEEAG